MRAATLSTTALVLAVGGRLAGQTALTQLGLTETAARNFLFEELKSPTQDRRSAIVVTGTRAFFKLPPSARAAAATGLFAWAKAYVNSPAFTAAYTKYRRDRIPQARQYDLTVEQAVKQKIDELLAGAERLRQLASTMSPAERANTLAAASELETQARDAEFIKRLQDGLVAERAAESGSEAEMAANVEEMTPADPKKLFARRLRQFLDATADVDFTTKTISLAGGADGIEFIEPAVRSKPMVWHEAVIVGPAATAAARAAAQAWLKEIEP
jgi:hypothetical protein